MTFRRQLTPKAEQLFQDGRQAARNELTQRWTLEDFRELMTFRKTPNNEDPKKLEAAPSSSKRHR